MRAIYSPRSRKPPSRPGTIDFGSGVPKHHSISEVLEALTSVSLHSDYLYYSPVGLFHHGGDPYRLPRFIFLGPETHGEPVKIGIFAGIHGDDAGSVRAVVEFLLRLNLQPERAHGYQIFAYPICNPTGFEDGTRTTRRGHDLLQEIWNGSRQPEAFYIERELGVLQFHGVIHLHSQDDTEVLHASVSSDVIRDAIVQPAIKAAKKFLPDRETRQPYRKNPGMAGVQNNYEWGLVNPAELKPVPFEITFETPRKAPPELHREAAIAVLNKIVEEYRPFLASHRHI